MTALRKIRDRSGQSGVTLVELMVSVLLASILVGGLFFMMSGQQTTYRQQINNTHTQQSLWGTMSFLQRWLRSAGYGFGACPQSMAMMKNPTNDGVMPSAVVALQVHNHCNLLVTKPGACPNVSDGPSDSFTVTAVHSARLATPSQPSAIISAAMALASSPLRVPSNVSFPQQFARGDLALLWDPAGGPCILLEVTGDPSGDPATLDHADKEPYNNGAWNWNSFKPGGFGVATRVTRIAPESHPRHFAVDPATRRLMTWTTLHADPSLSTEQKDLEVVADQIEDMQLSWACDVNADGNLDEGTTASGRQTDEWAFNTPGDTPPTCGTAFIGAVRITLTGRSHSEVPSARLLKITAAEDEDRASATADRFARAVLTTTIKTINLRVQ